MRKTIAIITLAALAVAGCASRASSTPAAGPASSSASVAASSLTANWSVPAFGLSFTPPTAAAKLAPSDVLAVCDRQPVCRKGDPTSITLATLTDTSGKAVTAIDAKGVASSGPVNGRLVYIVEWANDQCVEMGAPNQTPSPSSDCTWHTVIDATTDVGMESWQD